MNFGGKQLDAFLASPAGNASRKARLREFSRRYQNIAARARPLHEQVVIGALLAQAGNAAAALLTGHGDEHVQRVISRATDLVSAPDAKLNDAELFTILVAIQAHDVGNIHGRAKHEERIVDLLPDIVGDDIRDRGERHYISKIVQAHGGRDTDGSKDRIGRLPERTRLFGEDVRLRFLAALLRFSDELADDHTRAAEALLTRGLLPGASEAYHQYASVLRDVAVRAHQHLIELQFIIPQDLATRSVGLDNEEVFLLDYIFERTTKMHLERVYCSRFLSVEGIRIDEIKVNIDFLDHRGAPFHEPIRYRLMEEGYPGDATIYELCPGDLRCDTGERWTGEMLKARIERGIADGDNNA